MVLALLKEFTYWFADGTIGDCDMVVPFLNTYEHSELVNFKLCVLFVF
jgi:hypothetical protein